MPSSIGSDTVGVLNEASSDVEKVAGNTDSSHELETRTITPGKVQSDEAPPAVEDPRPGAKAGLTISQFWVALAGLNLGMLLTALDFNIVATAVPIISSQFDDYDNSSWIGTGFLVTFALSMPFGLCAGSKSMDMLIWSRAVQGLGAGGIYGLVNVIITDLVPLRDVGKYLSATITIWAIADVAGPLMGGAFSQYVTWRWCFWINLILSPISLGVTLMVLRQNIPSDNVFEKVKRFDYIGALLLCGGTVALLLGISWGGNTFPWSHPNVIGSIIGAVIMLACFFVWEFFSKDPVIDPKLFRNRAVLAICASEFFYGMNLLGMMYYVPQFFQLVFGDSATISGVGLLPMMLGLGVGNPIAGFITSKYGISKWNAVAGAAVMTLASGLITRWGSTTSRAEAYVELILLGLGQGAVMSGLLLTAQVAVDPALIGIVTGLVIFWMTIGDMFGIAFYAAVYINELSQELTKLTLSPTQIQIALQNVQTVNTFNADVRQQIVLVWSESLKNGWWLMFAAAAVSMSFALAAKQHKFAATS